MTIVAHSEETAINPFYEYLPLSVIPAEESPVAIEQRLIREAYDLGVNKVLKDKPLTRLYGFVAQGSDLAREAQRFLTTTRDSTEFNEKKAETDVALRDISKYASFIEFVEKRPFARIDEELQFRKKLVARYVSGEISLEELKDEIEEGSSARFDTRLYSDALRDRAKRAACNGLLDFMMPERGASTSTAKNICFGCPVFSQCGVITLASPNMDGIRVGLTSSELKIIKRSIGSNALRTMLNDVDAVSFRAATVAMLEEYQEVVVLNPPDKKVPGDKSKSEIIANNRTYKRQFVDAMKELTRIFLAAKDASDSQK